MFFDFYFDPYPNFPPRGKEYIFSPLGEIRKGVKDKNNFPILCSINYKYLDDEKISFSVFDDVATCF
jgi:hypothetical protein